MRYLRIKLSQLNFNEAAREATALKKQFCAEDEELYLQGRGADISTS